jgi:hypothetical protein
MKHRTFLAVGLLLCLLVAGVGSYYASSHPDGLEHVAATTGFGDSAEDSAVSDSPIADYQVAGVDDDRLSGGLAGVLGVGIMALLSTALFWVVRRRGSHDAPADSPAHSPADSRG